MTVPSGTQGGQTFKLSGKGMPSSKTGMRGNQYVSIKVVIPKDLDSKAKEVINEVKGLYKEDPRKGLLRR